MIIIITESAHELVGSRRKSLFLSHKSYLSRVEGLNLETTDSNPTAFLSFHFQRTGSVKRETNGLGLLLDLRLQRITKPNNNARKTNFLPSLGPGTTFLMQDSLIRRCIAISQWIISNIPNPHKSLGMVSSTSITGLWCSSKIK
jgi:hypothetical protein